MEIIPTLAYIYNVLDETPSDDKTSCDVRSHIMTSSAPLASLWYQWELSVGLQFWLKTQNHTGYWKTTSDCLGIGKL